jgi:8-oxo-dGTP pyrophosphatase MutT (NUDIX family)|tara:strand:+ start:1276 stop:1680 length:405 start_codon:yes stop_codon:yes gene_type:complete
MIKVKIGKKKEVTGAIAVVLDEENRTLILLRPEEARWAPFKWGFPGGKIEDDEDAITAATRETKEETQLVVRNLKPLILPIDKPVRAYYTREYDGDVQIDYEHDDWAWVSRTEIEDYDLAPQVLEMFDWVLDNG